MTNRSMIDFVQGSRTIDKDEADLALYYTGNAPLDDAITLKSSAANESPHYKVQVFMAAFKVFRQLHYLIHKRR